MDYMSLLDGLDHRRRGFEKDSIQQVYFREDEHERVTTKFLMVH